MMRVLRAITIAAAAAAIAPNNVVAFTISSTSSSSSSSSRFAISQITTHYKASPSSSSSSSPFASRKQKTQLEMISMPSFSFSNKKEKQKSVSLFVKTTSSSAAKRYNLLFQKVKRSLTILFASAFLFLGSAKLYTPPTHASSATTTATIASRVVSPNNNKAVRLVSSTTTTTATTTLDKMVDKYIQKHIFNDDKYNALESTYRETHADNTGSSPYPSSLSSIATSVVGKRDLRTTLTTATAATKSTTSSQPEENTDMAAKVMKNMVQFLLTTSKVLQDKLNLAPNVAYGVTLFSCIIVAPAALFLFGMGFSNKQRLKMDELETERYGEVLGMYADRKKDVDIELEDDDEDGDDDDYDDEDDDDDDDE